MPRGPIQLRNYVESLSILDPEGNIDAALEPQLAAQDLRRLYAGMLRARRYDERMLKLQRQGRIGTYGPALGQEAASLGPAFAITANDWLIPSFREPAAMLYRGWPMTKLILWWGGNEAGATVPEGVNDLPICVPVSSQCLHAAGIAWGLKIKGEGGVAVAYTGDGGTSEGDFHEAMNVAGAFKLPLVMVIQNNHWAISLPRGRQSASETIAQKALAYGFNGIQVDGNDILATVSAAQEAVANARKGLGPTLIEAVTYRLGVHTTADDPKKYRSEEEVECWKAKDPLTRFATYLKRKNVLDDKGAALLEEEIAKEITNAVEQAEGYEPDMLEPFRHAFASIPPQLEAQLAEFQAYLESMGANGAGQKNGGVPASRERH